MPRIGRLIGIGYLALCIVILGGQIAGATQFYAPLAFIAAPQPEPVSITLIASPEKEAWLAEALVRFEASRPTVGRRPVKVQLEIHTSQEMVDGLRSGDLRPTALAPASSIELQLLAEQWRQLGSSAILAEGNLAAQPLAFTPLVLLTWREIGERRWSGDSFDWNELHQFVTSTDQGYLKLGHTRPTSANDGVALLLLLVYHYHNYGNDRQLQPSDLQDPGFQRWLAQFEEGVSVLDDSPELLVRNMILFGPSRYESIITYESLAISSALSEAPQWGELQVYYPPVNLHSDHPFAILQGDWISAEQQEAGRMLREHLLSVESQQLALSKGFRPANAHVSIESQTSPFMQLGARGVRSSLSRLVEQPPAEVAQALRDLWSATIAR